MSRVFHRPRDDLPNVSHGRGIASYGNVVTRGIDDAPLSESTAAAESHCCICRAIASRALDRIRTSKTRCLAEHLDRECQSIWRFHLAAREVDRRSGAASLARACGATSVQVEARRVIRVEFLGLREHENNTRT